MTGLHRKPMQSLVLKLQPEGPGVSRAILGRERCRETPFCTLPLPRGAEGLRRHGLLKAEGVGLPALSSCTTESGCALSPALLPNLASAGSPQGTQAA